MAESLEKVRQACEHDWKVVGFQERTPQVIAVVYACEKCSSWTYREMQFIGYRLETIEDEIEGHGPEGRGPKGERASG